ncbi:MAG: OsmC family peroxiredoxin [Luteitalea sp.]|nr:OsmC family peroxiredoxin [Luteitalea sp.]
MADVFNTHLDWSGAAKGATRDPATFSRDLDVSIASLSLPMSAAPGYRGDASRANPEQLLVAALSGCQALTYLYLTAKRGIAVVAYTDDAEGHLALVDGKMRVARVILRPRITLEGRAEEAQARELVDKAHQNCFIANSVSARVEIEPSFALADVPAAAE